MSAFEHLTGYSLAEGSFAVSAGEDAKFREAVGAPPDAFAHDAWAYVATQRGIGIGVAELCSLADFDMDDGPMLGSVRLEFSRPVELGRRYRVVGEIVGVERKEGRKMGPFDILTFRERLLDADGTEVASSTNTFVLPRRAVA